jgi:hypothetical protein
VAWAQQGASRRGAAVGCSGQRGVAFAAWRRTTLEPFVRPASVSTLRPSEPRTREPRPTVSHRDPPGRKSRPNSRNIWTFAPLEE